METEAPILSKQAFWDTNMASINYQKHARFVVEKVVTRGTLHDFISLRKFYGDEKIKQEIIKSRWLSDLDIYFCCTIFELEPQQFRCYTMKQSNPELWVY